MLDPKQSVLFPISGPPCVMSTVTELCFIRTPQNCILAEGLHKRSMEWLHNGKMVVQNQSRGNNKGLTNLQHNRSSYQKWQLQQLTDGPLKMWGALREGNMQKRPGTHFNFYDNLFLI